MGEVVGVSGDLEERGDIGMVSVEILVIYFPFVILAILLSNSVLVEILSSSISEVMENSPVK